MANFSNFHNLFSLSKTLRFRLKPIGKTQENFEKNILTLQNIFHSDEHVLYNNGLHGSDGRDSIRCLVLFQGRLRIPLVIELGAEDQQQDGLGADGSPGFHIYALLYNKVRRFGS